MAQASTLNPEKWLATLRVWVPTEPSENLVAFINSLIEASGPARVNGLDALIAHTEGTTRSGREKFETVASVERQNARTTLRIGRRNLSAAAGFRFGQGNPGQGRSPAEHV